MSLIKQAVMILIQLFLIDFIPTREKLVFNVQFLLILVIPLLV